MLRLYNSMSRSKEKFESLNTGEVKIFTCGPSTYRRPHIGNYRTFLYEDILVRYLEYSGYQVKRVINFTDVEDKMLEEAVAVGKTPELIAADTVVLCAGQEPERSLADALIAKGRDVHVIGGADRAAELDAKRAIDQGARLAASF